MTQTKQPPVNPGRFTLKTNCHYLTGTEPIAVMRREGISRGQDFLRIQEEMRAQDLNEDNVF